MSGILFSADPQRRGTEITSDPGAPGAGSVVRTRWRAMVGFTPVDFTIDTVTHVEVLPADFFSTTVADQVTAWVVANGYALRGAVELPPVAQDTTVWDPTTNAPYP